MYRTCVSCVSHAYFWQPESASRSLSSLSSLGDGACSRVSADNAEAEADANAEADAADALVCRICEAEVASSRLVAHSHWCLRVRRESVLSAGLKVFSTHTFCFGGQVARVEASVIAADTWLTSTLVEVDAQLHDLYVFLFCCLFFLLKRASRLFFSARALRRSVRCGRGCGR